MSNETSTKTATEDSSSNLPEYVVANRQYWNQMANEWVTAGERSWSNWEQPTWGIWELPESQLQLLPNNMSNMTAIELGCGTGYVSSWMIRRGATKVVGIDNSQAQLATAKRLATQHLDVEQQQEQLEWIHDNAEQLPRYADSSFDFCISEYGAAIWCDPYKWIPEATRLLKLGGLLVFLGHHPMTMIATPDNGGDDPCDEKFHRPYFKMQKFDWRNVAEDPGGVEFNLSISDWLALFRSCGLEVLDYQELQAPSTLSPDETKHGIPVAWAQKWPSEQVWKLRKKV